MLDDVQQALLKAIYAAGKKSGFILSTGDHCGRDMAGANIRAMVGTFGHYLLEMDRFRKEIVRLGGRYQKPLIDGEASSRYNARQSHKP